MRIKKSPAEAGLFEIALAIRAWASQPASAAAGFFAGGFGCTPTASTVTRRFGARHSMSCLRFILFEQNFVTGIGCLNALPSQKISFGSMPLLTT